MWSHCSSPTARGDLQGCPLGRSGEARTSGRHGRTGHTLFTLTRAPAVTCLQTFPAALQARRPRALLVPPALPTAASIPRSFFCYRLTTLLIFRSHFIHNYITSKLNSITENYLNQLQNLAEYVNYSSFKSLAAKIHQRQKLLTRERNQPTR